MLIVGLTGGVGSGKSTVANLFTKLGVPIIDTDQLARDVTQLDQPALKQIAEYFGPSSLKPDGTLDRARLRQLIFNDPTKRLWLEALLHPLIRLEMQRQISTMNTPYCIVVIPLLFETEPNPLINRVLVVDATEQLQLTRTMLRDKLPEQQAQAILKAQVDRNKRLAAADDIINNNDGIEELIPQVAKLHQFYLSLSQEQQ